jgi:hypothetical protein
MKKFITLIFSLIFLSSVSSQDNQRNWRLNGYLQDLQMVWIQPHSSKWLTLTTPSNRIDFRWFPGKTVSFHVGMRNIFNLGQMVQAYYSYYPEIAIKDDGYFDLTKLWVKDSSYFFFTNIDRANIKISAGKFEATIGRQRINWGINLVWTPNDIFNSFNYFDFDYVERPGCDAVLLEYFTGNTSSVQFGFKMDHEDKITSALMYRFNRWKYDFQFMGGVMKDDLVGGLGWSGEIGGAGFNGEASYFLDKKKVWDTTGVLVASIGINYTFRNSLYLHGSYLFNSAGTTGPAGWGIQLTQFADISAKNFTLAKHNLFGEVAYQVSPLIRADLSSIYNPNDKSGFVGPSMDFSLTNNISLFFIAQVFWGEHMTEFGDNGSQYYLRLKWGF